MYQITINGTTVVVSELDYDLIPDNLKQLLEENNMVTKDVPYSYIPVLAK